MSFPHSEGPALKIYEMVSNENIRTIDNMLRALGYSGDRYFVDQDVGNDAPQTTGSKDDPFDTPDYAVGRTTANNGDVIYVLPSTSQYDGNVNAGGIELDVAGVALVMPTGSSVQLVNSHASATAVITVTADNVTIIGGYIGEDTTTVEGILTTSVDDVRIYDTIFDGNMENGVHITDGARCRVVDCYFYIITDDGIEISGASIKNMILGNYFAGAAGDNAIHLNGNGVDENIVLDNIVNGGTGHTNGISVALGDLNLISGGFIIGCTNPISDTGSDNSWNVPVDVVSSGTFNRTVANDVNEDTGDIDDIDLPSSGEYEVALDINALEAAGEGGTITIRLYRKIDDTTYRIVDKSTYQVGVDEIHPMVSGVFESGDSKMRVSHQTSVAVTANRAMIYKIVQKR